MTVEHSPDTQHIASVLPRSIPITINPGFGWGFLIAACCFAGIYILALHPWTGVWGGLIFLAVGWLMPSLVNLSLAAWLVSFLQSRRLRLAAFLPVSFLLGLNVSLPIFLWVQLSSLRTESEVHRTVPLGNSRYGKVIDIDSNQRPIATNPLGPLIAAGPDSGCICMYFATTDDYGWKLVSQINRLASSSRVDSTTFWVGRYITDAAAHTGDFIIEVHDGREITASFVQHDVPFFPVTMLERIGRDRGLLNGYFLANVAHVLMHGSFWNTILGRISDPYPERAIGNFLERAIEHPA